MTALLGAVYGWAKNLPQAVRIVALGAILCGLATFWAYERGERIGRARERIAADIQLTAALMANLRLAKIKVDSQTNAIVRSLPKLKAAHDAAKPIDSVHLAVVLTKGAPAETIYVPGPVVQRITADSFALAERDSLIRLLQGQARAADSVIDSQTKTITDMETTPASSGPSFRGDVLFGAATGATVGAVVGSVGGLPGRLLATGVGAGVGVVAGAVLHAFR